MFIVYFIFFYSTVQHSVHSCWEECSINKVLLTYLLTQRSGAVDGYMRSVKVMSQRVSRGLCASRNGAWPVPPCPPGMMDDRDGGDHATC